MQLNRPRILHLVNQSHFGGTQEHIICLAKHQTQQGYEVTIGAGEKIDHLFGEAVSSIPHATFIHLKSVSARINPIKDIISIFELGKLIQKIKPTIIHIHSPKLNLLTGIAVRLLKRHYGSGSPFQSNNNYSSSPFGKLRVNSVEKSHNVNYPLPTRLDSSAKRATRYPLVYTIHGFWLNEKVSLFKHIVHYLIEWAGIRLMNFVIGVCQQDISDARRMNILSPKIQTAAIYNALNPQTVQFLEPLQAKQALQQIVSFPLKEKKILGVISGLYPSKGIETLIEAMHTFSHTNIVCLVIGDGPMYENLKLKIKNLKLENQIFLLSYILNASQYLTAFNILVLPSLKEGLPTVLLEACAAGIPVVATEVGGNNEIKQSNWIMVPPLNPQALAKAIEKGLELPKLPPKTHVQLQKEYDEFLRKIEEVYDSVLCSKTERPETQNPKSETNSKNNQNSNNRHPGL